MSDELIKAATHITALAVDKYSNERGSLNRNLDMAEEIKKYFDKKHLGGWHCIVGRNFGMYVSHEEGSFILLAHGHLKILIFRCLG